MPSTTRRLLEAWEVALPLTPARRAQGLVGVLAPELSPAAVGALSVGERDEALLRLREAVFGPDVTAVGRCPACGERVELSFEVDDVHVVSPEVELPIVVERDGWSVRCRPPTSADLVSIEQVATARQAADELWRHCTVEVTTGGSTRSPEDVPAPVRASVAARLAAVDPQADVQIRLACPACQAGWEQVFDIASFLWTELDAWARRLLGDVHVLASAYGWDEEQILALSPSRRRAYLGLVVA
jgi:uncharacterized protein (UPF0212 family)